MANTGLGYSEDQAFRITAEEDNYNINLQKQSQESRKVSPGTTEAASQTEYAADFLKSFQIKSRDRVDGPE